MTKILFFAAMLLPATALGAPRDVTVQQLRVVLERRGQIVEVTQFVRLVGPGAGVEKGQLALPLPSGATGARYREDDNPGISVGDHAMIVEGKVPPDGRMVSYTFDLPIENDSIALKQNFGRPVLSAQVISMWTLGEVTLHGQGFGEAQWVEASTGLQAVMATASRIENGLLDVRLGGLVRSPMVFWRWGTLVLSALLLCLGFVVWLKGRLSSREELGN